MTYCTCGHRLVDHTQGTNRDGTWRAPCMRCDCIQWDDDPQRSWSLPDEDGLSRAIRTVEQMRTDCRNAAEQTDTVRGMALAFTLALLSLRSIQRGTSPADELQGVLL